MQRHEVTVALATNTGATGAWLAGYRLSTAPSPTVVKLVSIRLLLLEIETLILQRLDLIRIGLRVHLEVVDRAIKLAQSPVVHHSAAEHMEQTAEELVSPDRAAGGGEGRRGAAAREQPAPECRVRGSWVMATHVLRSSFAKASMIAHASDC